MWESAIIVSSTFITPPQFAASSPLFFPSPSEEYPSFRIGSSVNGTAKDITYFRLAIMAQWSIIAHSLSEQTKVFGDGSTTCMHNAEL